MNEIATAVREPSFVGYYAKINPLYENLRELQPQLAKKYKNGEDARALAAETWELFKSDK